MSNVVFRSRDPAHAVAPCVLLLLPQVPLAAKRITHRSSSTHSRSRPLPSSSTHRQLRDGGTAKVDAARWKEQPGTASSSLTPSTSNFNICSCQVLSHTHPRLRACLPAAAPTLHVTLSDIGTRPHSHPRRPSFPPLRFKTPTDHVLREPVSRPVRHFSLTLHAHPSLSYRIVTSRSQRGVTNDSKPITLFVFHRLQHLHHHHNIHALLSPLAIPRP
jgi:hypothetical protein